MDESGSDELGIEGLEDPVEVGVGGFATVYKAFQPAFRRTVAAKILAAVNQNASQMRDTAQTLTGVARTATSESSAASAASEDTSSKVQTVAAAAERHGGAVARERRLDRPEQAAEPRHFDDRRQYRRRNHAGAYQPFTTRFFHHT